MDAINSAVTALFDVILTPLEAVSEEFALIVVSGVFGVLALWAFKHISWQKGIKALEHNSLVTQGYLMLCLYRMYSRMIVQSQDKL